MKQHNCRVMTMLWLGANGQTCSVLVIFGIFVPCSLRSRKTAGWQRSGSQSLGPTVPSPHTWMLRSSMSDRSTTQWWTQRNLLALENTNNNKLVLQQHACQSWKHSSATEADPCTNAQRNGLLLNSATLKWFLGTSCAPSCICFVRWWLKISHS